MYLDFPIGQILLKVFQWLQENSNTVFHIFSKTFPPRNLFGSLFYPSDTSSDKLYNTFLDKRVLNNKIDSAYIHFMIS